MIQILIALLAGIFTIGAPCILPVLPILLGASVGQRSKTRPLFIALGFIITFSITALLISSIVSQLMVPPDVLRRVAVVALAIFAILMFWPLPFELLTTKLSGLTTSASGTAQKAGNGNFGGLILGLLLGLIWTPCAGPVLGSILTLIAAQGEVSKALPLLVAYAIGAGIPMLLIAYGGQAITTRINFLSNYSRRLQQIFGIIILLLAAAIFFQYDTKLQSKLVEKFPAINLENKLFKKLNEGSENRLPLESKTNKVDTDGMQLPNYGPAPEFVGIEKWLNSDSLTMEQLKGKVVLIDFWTYSCINCIRTLPYVTKWYDTYKDKGLVVVGVHTPEFAFEKVTSNVETAIKRFNINYPVAQDNNYATWNAYNNRYWPAEYLVDQNGNLVYYHFGEGNYDHTENLIRQLLNIGGESDIKNPTQGNVKSPEMYFGTDRLEYLDKSQLPFINQETLYNIPEKNLVLNTFALEGSWQFQTERAVLAPGSEGSGKIRLRFNSGKVYMVAASGNPQEITVLVDGKIVSQFIVGDYQLYTLFDSNDYSEHDLEIQIPQAGFEAFTFTFG
jgi:cytochrome c biogenesis protein CcdA/thiol-disulfide isomerase/thioredoxin